MAREALAPLRRADPVLLCGFAAAAVALVYTLVHLASRSLWWDELFTLVLALPSTPDADAIAQIRGDVHPPLYFFGARVWMHLFNGSGEFAVRAFNLAPYGVALWMAIAALRRRGTPLLALWLALFFTAFGVFWYLQEARMYAMMIAQSLCGCLVVMGYEQRRTAPITPGYVAMLALVFLVLPFGHWFSIGFAGCLLLGLFFWALAERRLNYALLFMVLGVALGALGLTWILLNADSTVGAVDGYGGWVYGGALSLYGLRITTIGVLLFALTLNPILIAAAAWGMWLVVRAPRQNMGAAIILAASIVLGLAILAVSLFAAMYQTRNFVWLIAPLTLFAAMGLDWAFARMNWSRPRQAAALVGVFALSLMIAPFARNISPLELDAWRDAGRFITSTPGCADEEIRATALWLGAAPTETDYRLSQRILGYYAGGPERMRLVLRGEHLNVDADVSCPVVLWMAQTTEATARERAREILGPAADGLRAQTFEGHVVLLRDDGAAQARAGGA
jgi:hypothetical protein